MEDLKEKAKLRFLQVKWQQTRMSSYCINFMAWCAEHFDKRYNIEDELSAIKNIRLWPVLSEIDELCLFASQVTEWP